MASAQSSGMWVAAVTYDGAVYGWRGDPYAPADHPMLRDPINDSNALPFELKFATGAHTSAAKTAAFSPGTGAVVAVKRKGKGKRKRAPEVLVTGGADETLRCVALVLPMRGGVGAAPATPWAVARRVCHWCAAVPLAAGVWPRLTAFLCRLCACASRASLLFVQRFRCCQACGCRDPDGAPRYVLLVRVALKAPAATTHRVGPCDSGAQALSRASRSPATATCSRAVRTVLCASGACTIGCACTSSAGTSECSRDCRCCASLPAFREPFTRLCWCRRPRAAVRGVAVHPSNRFALSVGDDKALRMWNLVKGRAAAGIKLPAGGTNVVWAPDATRYVAHTPQAAGLYVLHGAPYSTCALRSVCAPAML